MFCVKDASFLLPAIQLFTSYKKILNKSVYRIQRSIISISFHPPFKYFLHYYYYYFCTFQPSHNVTLLILPNQFQYSLCTHTECVIWVYPRRRHRPITQDDDKKFIIINISKYFSLVCCCCSSFLFYNKSILQPRISARF